MVIFYDINTKEIKRTEDNTLIPRLPTNATFEEKKQYYRNLNEDFVSLQYEMGSYIFKFSLCFDENNNFVGLQPREV